ncbi:MAG: UDP-N-acetylmuramoyl-L-alanyl-D-glutamate--2,6-diaminopimelate ligase [Thermoanaerobaculia bacterium]
MRLTELLADFPSDFLPPPDPEITSVVSDSRRTAPGSLFVAIRGEKANGLEFVESALSRGAAAIAAETKAPSPAGVPWIRVSNARRAASVLSSRALGDPSLHLRLAAVTGTNGKTTTAVLLSDIFRDAWGQSGFLGTTGYRWGTHALDAPRTTPEGDILAETLARMVDDGVPACAMEVSSHALALERVAGLRFDAAVFTNLTRDHLDFHGTLENYGAAKARLFGLRKKGATGVVNVDDPFGAGLLGRIEGPKISFSPSGSASADFRAESISVGLEGTSFQVAGEGKTSRVESPLVGRFNVENLLGAWAAARSLGIESDSLCRTLAKSAGAPGRMERVEAGQPFTILVDYAHTEDALRRLLRGVRELTDKKIILVFGCGGDRDPGKREPMGRAAAELSDIPIATSDNPRGEDPQEILREVEVGLRNGGASKYLKFVDRREAIEKAIELANSRSIVVIAGKGHEKVQVIADRSEPFDDRVVAAEFAGRLRRATP